MSRRMKTTARGSQAQTIPARIKLNLDRAYANKRLSGRCMSSAKSNKKRKAPSVSDTESTTSGASSGFDDEYDAETEEADDDSEEEPEVDAPSHHTSLRGGAGPYDFKFHRDMEASEWEGFPEPDPEDPDVEIFYNNDELEKKLLDSDDDQVYDRVNEISESEDEANDAAVERAETEMLAAEFEEDAEDLSHFANQIDGMSAYGFGDGTEEDSNYFSWSSSDEAKNGPLNRRHVHFNDMEMVGTTEPFFHFGDSPTMTRALLPSALAEENNENEDGQCSNTNDEDYDTDATEELEAPAEKWRALAPRRHSFSEVSPTHTPLAKPLPGQKGPAVGTFEDNGEKAIAMLDSTGKKLLVTDSHLLGGVFAYRYGHSAPASPGMGLEEAVFGDSESSRASATPQPQIMSNVDLMISALASCSHAAVNGQATGYPEAFMPSNIPNMMDFLTPGAFAYESGDGEEHLNLDDMISYDGSSKDGDDNADTHDLLLPSFSAPATPLPQLSGMNVSAFKRKAEQPYFPHPGSSAMLKNKFTTPAKRKRPTRTDSPYNDAHYEGVTPVQRIHNQECRALSSSPAPPSMLGHKRRKTIL